MTVRNAAVGLRAHSGWAALVAVAGDGASVEVVDRRRVEMADPHHPLSKRPYHEAEDLPLEKARSALLLASGRPQPKLEAILASHALIHAADGEHFRIALREASQSCGLAVTGIREADLLECAQGVLGQPAARLQATVTGLGRALGPPWTQDQKLAALAAWVVLA